MKHLFLVIVLCGITTTTQADVFDHIQYKYLRCQDATRPCLPMDTVSTTDFWKSCLPNRIDCISSQTAVVGWNQDGTTKRGAGYCYTEYPFTCSPDGKIPISK